MKLAAAVLSLVACGCSLALVKGPPKPVPPQGPITCDTAGGGAVVADVMMGTISGLLLAYVAYALSGLGNHGRDPAEREDPSVAGTVGFGLLVASPWYLSAYVGISRASDCRAVKSQTGR